VAAIPTITTASAPNNEFRLNIYIPLIQSVIISSWKRRMTLSWIVRPEHLGSRPRSRAKREQAPALHNVRSLRSMAIKSAAVIYDERARPEMIGGYCLRALKRKFAVDGPCGTSSMAAVCGAARIGMRSFGHATG
jgi:hypothetical protein